jgi:VanZ family protein
MTGFTRLPSNTPPINKAPFVSSDTTHHRLSRYGPLVVWAALIFIGSSSVLSASHTSVVLRPVLWLFPHASEATLALIHFLVRKAGHLTEYAILALFAARAFRTSSHELLRNRWFWVSLLFVVAYSLSDEFHQSFVPSRTASIYDSMIDSVGGAVALTILWWRRGRIANRTNRERFKSGVVI